MKKTKIILTEEEPGMNPNSIELADVIIKRIGLYPRKEGSTQNMNRTFIELYERAKRAAQKKKPEEAVMTVEEMGTFAGITRQTMYDYLKRWTDLGLIIKTSYIKGNDVIIGYKLNGNTIESAFEKTYMKIKNNLETTQKYIKELQKIVKNEKIKKASKR